jgi:pimeloyl-ACP methyl ester carboxylesterase
VLGISIGRTALKLALSCPGRVGRLVLVSTSAAGRGKVTVSWPMRLLPPLRWAGLLRGKYAHPRYAYLRQRQASASYNTTDRRGGICAPALILHGRRDRSTPVNLAERMHAGIPGSRMELFRGGHMFFLFYQTPAVPRPGRPFLRRVTTQRAETSRPSYTRYSATESVRGMPAWPFQAV